VPEADDCSRHPSLQTDFDRTLGDVFGEVAHPLEVAGDADRTDDFAQIVRHGVSSGDGEDCFHLDFALQCVDLGSVVTT